MKEFFHSAHDQYQKYLGNRTHLLSDKSTNGLEVFFTNKNHAPWDLIYKNIHLEFPSSSIPFAATVPLQEKIDRLYRAVEKKIIA